MVHSTTTTSLGVPLKSQGAVQITVELSGNRNIFHGNAAGAPGKISYHRSFNIA
jgi:hypothetical protein